MNTFQDKNIFGPIQFSFPKEAFLNRNFHVFKRIDVDKRERLYFVEFSEKAPKFVTNNSTKKILKACFVIHKDGNYRLKDRAIYYLLAANSISISNAWIEANTHKTCYANRCNGTTFNESHKAVKALATFEIEKCIDERLVDLVGRYSNIAPLKSTPSRLVKIIYGLDDF